MRGKASCVYVVLDSMIFNHVKCYRCWHPHCHEDHLDLYVVIYDCWWEGGMSCAEFYAMKYTFLVILYEYG